MEQDACDVETSSEDIKVVFSRTWDTSTIFRTINIYICVSAQNSKASLLDIFFTRDSIYAIARICYRPSVRPSVTRMDHRNRLKLGL